MRFSGRGLNRAPVRADAPRMLALTIAAAVAAALAAAILTGNVMATRLDHAARFADLVRSTRRLRAAHRAQLAVAPRPRRR